jgi:hypothetical protein
MFYPGQPLFPEAEEVLLEGTAEDLTPPTTPSKPIMSLTKMALHATSMAHLRPSDIKNINRILGLRNFFPPRTAKQWNPHAPARFRYAEVPKENQYFQAWFYAMQRISHSLDIIYHNPGWLQAPYVVRHRPVPALYLYNANRDQSPCMDSMADHARWSGGHLSTWNHRARAFCGNPMHTHPWRCPDGEWMVARLWHDEVVDGVRDACWAKVCDAKRRAIRAAEYVDDTIPEEWMKATRHLRHKKQKYSA